ncbi:MAG: Na(+)-translocating NADH-quinone reductase subunit A [Chlamydiae bacterium]|nr:Na(+)-translocating NADH-quinone reductase subunit A [Chlamydiota bacterium]
MGSCKIRGRWVESGSMRIRVKRGLDVPIRGKPERELEQLPTPKKIALNLDPFDDTRFRVLVKAGERVQIGQPLVESKAVSGQMFVSPAGGVVKEIRRGLKRRLLDLVIERDETEESLKLTPPSSGNLEELLAFLLQGGAFPYIRMRPFHLVADPKHLPRDIFVSAVESLPFAPSAERQVEGHEEIFQTGLETLAKLTDGKVHLVYREGSTSKAFTEAREVEKHTISGPHPVGTTSLHIQKVAPIRSPEDFVWTLSSIGVLTLGKLMREGTYFTDRVLSLAGEGIIAERRGYLHGRAGMPVESLIANRITNEPLRLISGDPLVGVKVEARDFLGFYDTCFCAIPENTKRQLFHFLRLGLNKYSATKAYATGHAKPPKGGYSFSTNQHGEERAFIDGAIYEKVMPLHIPTMQLVKAILSEDFEHAEELGLLEVAPEDFALPTFICPSKIEMIDIVKKGLHLYSKEMGH